MGRKMVDEFIPYWTEVTNKHDDPRNAIAKKMVEIPKVVFTKSLTKSEWPNTEIATGDLKDEINSLKSRNGGESCIWRSLIRFLLDKRKLD